MGGDAAIEKIVAQTDWLVGKGWAWNKASVVTGKSTWYASLVNMAVLQSLCSQLLVFKRNVP
jgi:hypothetical protein